VQRITDVEIRQFWTEVPSPSFPIAHVFPIKKKMKTEWIKNKVFKPQEVYDI
jgi:hypothetical protein